MCVIAWRWTPDEEMVLTLWANRDEWLKRPTRPLARGRVGRLSHSSRFAHRVSTISSSGVQRQAITHMFQRSPHGAEDPGVISTGVGAIIDRSGVDIGLELQPIRNSSAHPSR